MRILLVEDDIILGQALKDSLHDCGYMVDWLTASESVPFVLEKAAFEVVLLNLSLAILTKTQLITHLRRKGLPLAIIIISEVNLSDNKVAHLDDGADDFLSKPFDFNELCARIRACYRRINGHTTTLLHIDNITLCPATHNVTVDQQTLNLPRREFALLQKLLENKGSVVSREQLTQSLYGWEKIVHSNALEVHIHQLRKKLRTDCIHSIYGIGYCIKK